MMVTLISHVVETLETVSKHQGKRQGERVYKEELKLSDHSTTKIGLDP